MNKLAELAKLFLKLGTIGFGGPAAHIAMMRQEVVKKRKWMDEQHFLDLIGATNLILGPISTEMTMHIGHERAGWKGLIVAGLCFILPAVMITGILAVLYKNYGQLPQVQPFVYGIKPAIIAIILAAVYPLVRRIRRSKLASVFLDAVNVASVAIILFVCFQMGKEAITEWRTITIAVTSLVAVFGLRKINSAWIVLGGAGLGYVLSLI